jgi:hypothetical protein
MLNMSSRTSSLEGPSHLGNGDDQFGLHVRISRQRDGRTANSHGNIVTDTVMSKLSSSTVLRDPS